MKRSPLKRKTALRLFSVRRQSQRERRREVVAEVMARDRTCRARDLVPQIRCWGQLDAHEIIPRSAWRDGYLEPSNVIAVCRYGHHAWIDNHPEEAHALGLHGFSWERP